MNVWNKQKKQTNLDVFYNFLQFFSRMGEPEISFPNVDFKKPGKLFISMLTTRSEEMANSNTHLGHLQV